MRRVFAVVACGAVSACATAPAAVPMEGRAEAVRALAGEWLGEYEGIDSGRSGSIVFRIAATGDSALGDVVMVPRAAVGRGDVQPAARPLPLPVALQIALVYVSERVVRGELAAYRDPECGCRLMTVFTGTIRGDVIDGTFTTTHLDTGLLQKGRWRVTRQPPG